MVIKIMTQSFYQPPKINIVNRQNWIIYSNYHRFDEKKESVYWREVFITFHIEIPIDGIVFCQQLFYNYAQSTDALVEKSCSRCNGSMEDNIFGCAIRGINFYINHRFKIIILLASKTDFFINPFVFLTLLLCFSRVQLPNLHTRI